MERWHRAVMQQSCKHSIEKTRRDKSVSTTLTGRRATLRQEPGSITDNHWHGHQASVGLGPAADSNCGEIGYSSYFYIKTPMKRHLIQGQWCQCQCQPSTPGVIAHVTASPRPGLQRGRTRCPVLTARHQAWQIRYQIRFVLCFVFRCSYHRRSSCRGREYSLS